VTNHDPLTRKTDIRNIFLCVAILAAAIVLVWPVGESAYGDDSAYAHMALQAARTGHFAYNGWEAAVMILHVYWGALFIRLFGFSFDCVRFSTLPFAFGSVIFCYLLVRRAGLRAKEALFVTALFALCPLFLPVAVSYMTDVPGLFFLFASLYALTRAAEASLEGRGYVWLALGVTLGFLGGTGRQVAWLAPLVVLPYLAWLRRSQRVFAGVSLAAWAAVLGGVGWVMAWFNRQPYVEPQTPLLSELKIALQKPAADIGITARILLTILLLCLPATVPLLWEASRKAWSGTLLRKLLVIVSLIGVTLAVLVHPSVASFPWLASTLNWEGINGSQPLLGRPIVITRAIRAAVALAVYAVGCILAGELVNLRELARRASRAFLDETGGQFALVAMSLVSVVYFALTVIRASHFDIFDRFLLPVLPLAATVFLLWVKPEKNDAVFGRWGMPVALASLAVLGSYAILSTQDLWALSRARIAATIKLEGAGVPRTAIDAGSEYNVWTELQINGRVNGHRVVNPPGAYRPGLGPTPSVVPEYRLEFEPTAETVPSEFGSVPYFSLLPPFRKQVSIDRLVAPSSSN
jgi:Dolichyl-phosphate-mannose-protein mannosyltransferase